MRAPDCCDFRVFHTHALKKGDRIIVCDQHSMTYRKTNEGVFPFPSETSWMARGKILGYALEHFGRFRDIDGREPGFYENENLPYIETYDDNRHNSKREWRHYIEAYGIMLADTALYRRRIATAVKTAEQHKLPKPRLVKKLPDTPFWEGDIVLIKTSDTESATGQYMVASLDFRLTFKKDCGKNKTCPLHEPTASPLYNLLHQLEPHDLSKHPAEHLELVERGPFWKQAHGEPLKFDNLGKETLFASRSGGATYATDKIGQKFWFQKSDAVSAFKDGVGDCLYWDGAGWDDYGWCLITFNDRDLGARARVTSETGFIIPSYYYIEDQKKEYPLSNR